MSPSSSNCLGGAVASYDAVPARAAMVLPSGGLPSVFSTSRSAVSSGLLDRMNERPATPSVATIPDTALPVHPRDLVGAAFSAVSSSSCSNGGMRLLAAAPDSTAPSRYDGMTHASISGMQPQGSKQVTCHSEPAASVVGGHSEEWDFCRGLSDEGPVGEDCAGDEAYARQLQAELDQDLVMDEKFARQLQEEEEQMQSAVGDLPNEQKELATKALHAEALGAVGGQNHLSASSDLAVSEAAVARRPSASVPDIGSPRQDNLDNFGGGSPSAAPRQPSPHRCSPSESLRVRQRGVEDHNTASARPQATWQCNVASATCGSPSSSSQSPVLGRPLACTHSLGDSSITPLQRSPQPLSPRRLSRDTSLPGDKLSTSAPCSTEAESLARYWEQAFLSPSSSGDPASTESCSPRHAQQSNFSASGEVSPGGTCRQTATTDNNKAVGQDQYDPVFPNIAADFSDRSPDILEMEEIELHAELQDVREAWPANLERSSPREECPSPETEADKPETGCGLNELENGPDATATPREECPAPESEADKTEAGCSITELDSAPDTITLCLRLGFVMVKKEIVDEADAPKTSETTAASDEESRPCRDGPGQPDVLETLQRPVQNEPASASEEDEEKVRQRQVELQEQQQQQEQTEQLEAAQLASYEAHAAEKKDRETRDRHLVVECGDIAPLESRNPQLLEAVYLCVELLQSSGNRELLWRYVQTQELKVTWYLEYFCNSCSKKRARSVTEV